MISLEHYLQFSPYFARLDTEADSERSKFLADFEKAPDKIKSLILATETAEKILNICGSFGLDEFDTETIALLLRKVMLRDYSADQLGSLAAKSTEVEGSKSESLAKDLLNTVLSLEVSTPGELGAPQATNVNPGNVVNLRNTHN